MHKNFIKITILLLFFTILIAQNSVQAVPAQNGKIVKVGISNANFKDYYFNNITVSATDSFRLNDKNTNTVISDFGAGENIKIVIKDNLFSIYQDSTEIASKIKGPVVVESDNGFVTVANLKRAGKPAYYRGTFEITKVPSKNNQFNVIKELY